MLIRDEENQLKHLSVRVAINLSSPCGNPRLIQFDQIVVRIIKVSQMKCTLFSRTYRVRHKSLYIQLKERLLRIAFDKTDFKNSFNLFHCY